MPLLIHSPMTIYWVLVCSRHQPRCKTSLERCTDFSHEDKDPASRVLGFSFPVNQDQWYSDLSKHQKYLESWLEHRLLGLPQKHSNQWGAEQISISNRFSSGVDAAGLETTLWEPLTKANGSSLHCACPTFKHCTCLSQRSQWPHECCHNHLQLSKIPTPRTTSNI